VTDTSGASSASGDVPVTAFHGEPMTASKTAVIKTHCPKETAELGQKIGEQLQRGDVLALVGPLGAGKTQFTRGLALGLGAAARVTSPSFKLVNEYSGRIPLYHIDAYRLRDARDMIALGCDEFFDGDGAAAVEWADRVPEALPPQYLRIDIEITGESTRRITLTAVGPRAEELLRGVLPRGPE